MMTESPSSDSLNADMGPHSNSSNSSSQGSTTGPPTPAIPKPLPAQVMMPAPSCQAQAPPILGNVPPMNSTPMPKRQKSWELLDPGAMGGARKGSHVTQAQVRTVPYFHCVYCRL